MIKLDHRDRSINFVIVSTLFVVDQLLSEHICYTKAYVQKLRVIISLLSLSYSTTGLSIIAGLINLSLTLAVNHQV